MAVPAPIAIRRKTILVAESDPLVLKLLCTILKSEGFTVLSAVTSEIAIRMEQEFTGPLDLLVTCPSLKPVSGPELAEKFQQVRGGLRVLLISGDPSAHALAMSCAWYFLQKPFVPSAFLREIKWALDFVANLSASR